MICPTNNHNGHDRKDGYDRAQFNPLRSRPSGATLITGGAGFVGTNVAARLAKQGQRVLIYDSLSRAGVAQNARWLQQTFPKQVTLIKADIRDQDQLDSAVAKADRIFHFAAQVAVTTSLKDPLVDFSINARGTLNLLEAARRQPTPPAILFTSTNKVYGNLSQVNVRRQGKRYEPAEGSPYQNGLAEQNINCRSPYGCSKGAADQYMIDYAYTFGLPAVVFRMSCIYGPHQFGNEDQGWVAHFLLRAIRGEPITIFGDGCQVRDVLYVDDLVNAMLLAIEDADNLAGQAYNIGGGSAHSISLLQLLGMIEQFTGRSPQHHFDEWRPGDQHYYVSDTSAIEKATGWRPKVSPEEGVERLYRWLVKNDIARQSPVKPAAIAS